MDAQLLEELKKICLHGTFRPLSCRISLEGLFITQGQNRGESYEQRESRI